MHSHTAVPFWRDVRVLTILSQIVFVVVVGLVAGYLINNLLTAMQQRHLVAGFDFLGLTAGFEIGESLIPYQSTDTYARAFIVGILNTVLVSIVGIFLSSILGFIVGIARLSSNWLVNRLAAGYIEIFRNTPLLVQLVFVYFGVFVKLPTVSNSIELPGAIYASQRGVYIPRPIASATFMPWLIAVVVALVIAFILYRFITARTRRIGLGLGAALVVLILIPAVTWFLLSPNPLSLELPERGRFNFSGGIAMSPEFSALLTGLVLYTAAFIAEVVRGGIQAVSHGQIEAAHALGLGELEILRLITIPQALRVIIPPLTSQYLNLAKNSSLAIAIGFPDLFSVGATIANQTGQPVPVIMLIMAIYLAISLVTSLFMNIYNQRVQILEK